MEVILYDTTLRDGTQGEGVQLSVADKLQIAQLLDNVGVSYIEGGWPGSNPRDEAFFTEARKLKLTHARLAAFAATRRAGIPCDDDPSIQASLAADVPVLTIFGKCWRFQATEALRISPEENLEIIEDTCRYLAGRVDEVVFDAEHFFDGYADDPDYAIACLRAAADGGAKHLVLCETNGGALPEAVRAAVEHVALELPTPLGIHTHNDAELGVANALVAVQAGAKMVQGTINGVGERCGNANLISIIPGLQLKLGMRCVTEAQLAGLRTLARTFDEVSNRVPNAGQPYVGRSAFAHKGGMHVDAIRKNPRTYEHIDPELVGNTRRILMSDLSGRANVHLKAKEFGIDLDPKSDEASEVLARLKALESEGYTFEAAGASFKLVIDEVMGKRPEYFHLRDLQVNVGFGEKHPEAIEGETHVHLEIRVGSEVAFTSCSGNGPVHAMDRALRSLIDKFYPQLAAVHLVDYKVRVMASADGTASSVRVLIQSSDGEEVWGTVGASPNVIHASWKAMVDALTYKLMKAGVSPYLGRAPRARRDTAPETVRARASQPPPPSTEN